MKLQIADCIADWRDDVLTAGTKLGPYEIVAPLGAGGMGVVYLARDARLERNVAIKLLAEDAKGDASARQRFRREVLAAAALDRPYHLHNSRGRRA